MKKTTVLLIAFFIGLESCETDFEVNAPWRDITVVYGLLNQNDNNKGGSPPHIIKINKAFLGEADVNDMAQIRDSSEYGPDEITVKIQRSLNGSSYSDYDNLARYEASNKPAGTFYNPDHSLYSFTDTLLPGYDYRLVITKTATGKKVYAETQIIRDFTFSKPNYWNALHPKVGFYKNENYFPFNKAYWITAVNGRRYQLTVRFHYTEIELNTDGTIKNTTVKSLDWVFPARKSKDLDGGDEIGNEINGEDFYKFVGNRLDPPPADIIRCIGRAKGSNYPKGPGHLDFIVIAAGEDLNTYLEVNEPSTSIVQERPEYTNVFDENGNEQAGFFSSRYTISEEGAQLSTDGVAGTSVTELKTGQYTGDLGFIAKVDDSKCPL